MKKCTKCGNMIENDLANFCNRCGSNVLVQLASPDNQVFRDDILKRKNGDDRVTTVEPISYSKTPNSYSKNYNSEHSGGYSGRTASKKEPNDYMAFAILSTLFCCLPLGVYAIICSTRVGKYCRIGDYERAENESKKTKRTLLISLFLSLIYYIAIVCAVVLGEMGNNSTYSNEVLLESTISEDRKLLPVDIGDGMRNTDIKIEGDYVLYDVICDEDFIDISLLNENYDNVKDAIEVSLRDATPDVQQFLNLCKQARKGIAYKYIGDVSRETATIRIPYDELNDF